MLKLRWSLLAVLGAALGAWRLALGSELHQAPGARHEAPIALLLAPGLSLADLDDPRLPNLRALGQTGSLALMNVTMARWRTDLASACLTLGAGVRMAAPPGFAPALDGSRVDPGDLARLHRTAEPRGAWGKLGAALRGRGNRIGLVLAPSKRIGAGLLLAVMDKDGAVAEAADPVPLVRRAPDRPYGLAADLAAVSAAARGLLGRCELVAVDAGDLERARQYAPLCLPERAAAHRQAALTDLDRLLGEVREAVTRRNGTLFVLSPVAARELPYGLLLVAGPRWPAGLLTSSATRTPGLVTNTDFLTTLVGSSEGRRPGYRPTGDGTTKDLRRLAAASRRAEAVRPASWGLLRGVLLCLALIAALPRGRRLAGRLAVLPLLPFLLPLFLLLAGDVVAPPSRAAAAAHTVMVALGLIGLLGLIVPSLRRRIPKATGLATGVVGSLAATTTMLLFVDLVTGGHLLRWSPLGYSLSLGARYYGIGNEAAGLLLGNALLVPFALAASWPGVARFAPALGLLLFAGVAFGLGSPSLGANFGTALAAVAAAALALPRLLGRRVALRHFAIGLAAAGICAAILALWDAARPVEVQTHLGRLVGEIRTHGVAPLLATIAGKAWTGLRVAAGLWGVLVVLQAGVGLRLLQEAERSDPLYDGLYLLLPTALALLLFNDSGVISATLALAPLPTLAALLVERRNEPYSKHEG